MMHKTYISTLLRYTLIILLTGLFLFETYIHPPHYSKVPELTDIVYQIKALSDNSVIIHYPFTNNMKYQLWSIYHGKRMVNGYASFAPQLYKDARNMMRKYPDKACIDWLKDNGITHVVVEGTRLIKIK